MAAIKWYARVIGGSTPSADPRNWDGEVNWLTPSDISLHHGGMVGDSERKITEAGLNECGAALAPAGSIVVTTRAPIGNVAITDWESCTNQGCRTIVPGPDVDARFLRYQLQTRIPELQARGSGSTFQELSGRALGSLGVFLPLIDRQRKVANFLDRECARIDQLLLETDEASALGTEWQAAQVERALVGCPDIRIKYLGFRVTQGWSPEADDRSPAGDEVGVLRLSAISMGRFDPTAVKALLPGSYADAERYMLTDGDVLIVRASGSLRLLGAAAQVVDLNGARVIYPDLMYRLEPVRAAFAPDLLPYVLRTHRGRAALEGAKRGAANNKLRMEDVREVRIPAPIAVEAQDRARLVISRTEPVARRLSETAREFAQSLSEYRDALITEAVMGQLDVARLGDAQMEESLKAVRDGVRPEVLAF